MLAKEKNERETNITEIEIQKYIVIDPSWYAYTPVYYTYYPGYWYFWDYWYSPVIYLRKQVQNTNEVDTNKMQNELKALDKEIWGVENFSTESLRSENKAYDPKWLFAQLKISRALFLEDALKQKTKRPFIENFKENERKKNDTRLKSLREQRQANVTEIQQYIAIEPYWYTYTPIYYTYYPGYWYFWDYWYSPAFIFRKEQNSSEKEFDVEKATRELKALKKEIWGTEDFSTETLRNESKAYDPKWLLAQIKISRSLFLEDVLWDKNMIAANKNEKKIYVHLKNKQSIEEAELQTNKTAPKFRNEEVEGQTSPKFRNEEAERKPNMNAPKFRNDEVERTNKSCANTYQILRKEDLDRVNNNSTHSSEISKKNITATENVNNLQNL